LKIAYLHGLESNNLGPKNEWLKTISNLFDPLIDYREVFIYQKLKLPIRDFNPDVIIGSSMGGYFAFEIAKDLNISCILFNPALHSRSFEPDTSGYKKGIFKPKMHFVFGENDSVINPFKTIEIIKKEGFFDENYTLLSHAHSTSLELFKEEIIKFTKNINN
jgi:hypothetical protein